jgi:hypothetical protein
MLKRSGCLLLPAVAKFADLLDEKVADLVDENLLILSMKNLLILSMKKLKDPARITKSRRRDPHGRRQLTRVNSTNVLDEGLRIGEIATTRDSGIEIGTRCT